ncbi:hypothetical protein [Parasedimentitalea psychrophila]|uniref:Spore coat protein U domain-containing protein n=1 Tax=Parasedimentitalea psychrophila TaxID=2997337 RepID=A0A9Y2KZH1_9RHOB|nr:hypothetical protein [Parasedimentitalea psychrophila]WIY25961.1 hypothetical protein QPJ95_03215 [Parasedimentitalea psychrophila]
MNLLNKKIMLLTTVLASSLLLAPAAMAEDGLTILNGSAEKLNLQVSAFNGCNSNNLKGAHTIKPNSFKSYDVSGGIGKSCTNTAVASIGAAQTAFTFNMSSGNPAYIQDLIVVSGGGLSVKKSGDHDLQIGLK